MHLHSGFTFLQSKTRKCRWLIAAVISFALIILTAGVTFAVGFDYGDAPINLSTTGSGPANIVDAALTSTYASTRNNLDSTYHLGSLIDADTANQPSANADGDDRNNLADEDGVTFSLAGSAPIFNAGQSNTLTINAATNGFLNAWIDWNQNGSWGDAGERIANNLALSPGNNSLSVTVSNRVPHGSTYARFRFSQNSDSTGSTGNSSQNGEVEDYLVNIALPAPLACTAGILNNGFETPIIPASGSGIPPIQTDFGGNRIVNYREADVDWWGTISTSPSSGSGFDNRNAIELWRRGNTVSPLGFEGSQFAELNANVAGELYQDIAVPPFTEIRWQVAHRGRSGTDTFGVYIGTPGSEIQQGSYSTPNSEWRVYSGIYTVPIGQYITRFGLRAISTSGGNTSVGNFVDDVRLTNFCAPTVQGFKSVKLTTDADNNGQISPGDTLTYTLYYVNALSSITGPAAGFQINDPLPSGLSVTATGSQTVTVSGGSTYAIKNTSYTGAATGVVSDLLAPGALLDVGGVIRIDIPVRVNTSTSGIRQNQAVSSATEFFGQNVRTDNVDSTTTGLPAGVTIPANSLPQTKTSSIDPTTVQVVNPNNPNVLLVKRITAINGSTNGRLLNGSGVDLTQFVDDPNTTDDNNPLWPSGFLNGAIDGGIAKPSDEVEYTIYFLSSGGGSATNVKLCDRIPDKQTFVPQGYASLPAAAGGDGSSRGISVAYNGTDSSYTNRGDGDTAQYYERGVTPLPAVCGGNLSNNPTGAVVINLGQGATGTTGGSLPHATTTPNSDASTYGLVRFKAKVD